MRRSIALLTVLICLGANAAMAQTYLAENRVRVSPGPGGDFTVIDDEGIGPSEFWCAAGSYAQVRLGAGAAQRVYIRDGRKRGSRQPVVFTLDEVAPEPGASFPGQGGNFALSVNRVGYNLTVSHARHLCSPRRFED